ncbi:MAG TPA: VOC family protein [Candidatus Paceibacterota bacterium]|jgi:predicted 3-demethylubiquinone-9 3-methyltransferase (glyoxalase superfamily)|nr:VOC family protein [Candidatus Paceibacterota bacterium]
MKSIIPYLWFDTQAEEAANFYVSLFKDSSVDQVARYGKEGFETHHMPEGTVMNVAFTLNGQKFAALNGGPQFKFSEAVSFQVMCEDQAEVDHYWNALSAGGKEGPCGWLTDKFGLSWQITPTKLPELMGSPDPAKAGAAMNAMLQMSKIDIRKLQDAYDAA